MRLSHMVPQSQLEVSQHTIIQEVKKCKSSLHPPLDVWVIFFSYSPSTQIERIAQEKTFIPIVTLCHKVFQSCNAGQMRFFIKARKQKELCLMIYSWVYPPWHIQHNTVKIEGLKFLHLLHSFFQNEHFFLIYVGPVL